MSSTAASSSPRSMATRAHVDARPTSAAVVWRSVFGRSSNTAVAAAKFPCNTRMTATSPAYRSGLSASAWQASITASAGAQWRTTWLRQALQAFSRKASGTARSASSANGSANSSKLG